MLALEDKILGGIFFRRLVIHHTTRGVCSIAFELTAIAVL
jgi:hypothetical protein